MKSTILSLVAGLTAAMLAVTPAQAQIREVDPNEQIDADLAPGRATPPPATSVDRAAPSASTPAPAPAASRSQAPVPQPPMSQPTAARPAQAAAPPPAGQLPTPTVDGQYVEATTYKRDDLIGAAEGVFGRGAEGLAGIIENVLRDQGEPNAYISGQEAAGAFVVGLRYGSGTMFHRVEGQRPVYWTGPSIGFDVGGDAAKTFVLVYNLYDSQELYKRFPQAEGRAYFVGGFSASYLRWGDVVLIPIRLGVGYRLGANIGYMKFSERQRWLPF